MKRNDMMSDRLAGVWQALWRRTASALWLGYPAALLWRSTAALAQDAAAPQPVPAGTVGTAALPQDLSTWGMIANADWVVKAIIAVLVLASVLTWTVALAKTLEFAMAGRRMRVGLAVLRSSLNLDDAARKLGPVGGPCATLIQAAQAEIAASVDTVGKEGIKERTAWQLERLVAETGRGLTRGTGMLATTGAIAPFVGLFGTVWGIMNSFIGISHAHTTNLAVVAPGIAEALLNTAIGLVAAIPAVVIYNGFARATSGQKARLADAVAETMRLLSRDLDRSPGARLRAVGE